MGPVAQQRDDARPVTYRDVFAVGEFRALWSAQVLSVIGDQLARVAVTLLVYDRTGSSLLAAVAFAASVVPSFIGGIFLAGLADRFPRRSVMIGCDLVRLVLVAVMTLPGMPVAALVALLFVLTVFGPPFTSARTAIYTDVLDSQQFMLGNAITITTFLLAQVAGFALGGSAVALFGARPSLITDAATYAISALITVMWVHRRPAARRAARRRPAEPRPDGPATGQAEPAGVSAVPDGLTDSPGRSGSIRHGLRLAFSVRALQVPMLFGLLAAFYDVPEGVAAPLGSALGAGQVAVGLILASGALGAAIGAALFNRLVPAPSRLRWMRWLAFAASALLVPFALRPSLPLVLALLLVSQLFSCYQVTASAVFVVAAPPDYLSQVFGIAQATMSLGQGAAMMAAGAAAEAIGPAAVIAVAGAVGALVSLVIPSYPRPEGASRDGKP